MGFFCATTIDDSIIASSFHSNAIVTLDEKFSVKDVQIIKKQPKAQYLHRRIIQAGDNLFFTPFIGNSILKLNLKTREESVFFIDENKDYFFADGRLYKNKIYLFPRILKHGLIIFDITTNVFTEDKGFIKNMKKMGMSEDQRFDTFSMDMEEGVIFFVPLNSNKIFKYTVNTGKLDYFEIENASFRNILLDDNNLWITSFDKPIVYRVNKCNGNVDIYENKVANKDELYHHALKINNRLILLPIKGYQINEIVDDKIVNSIEIHGEQNEINDSFAEEFILDNKLIFLPLMDSKTKVLDLEKNTLNLIDFDDSEIAIRSKYLSLFENQDIYESVNFNVRSLIGGLMYYE